MTSQTLPRHQVLPAVLHHLRRSAFGVVLAVMDLFSGMVAIALVSAIFFSLGLLPLVGVGLIPLAIILVLMGPLTALERFRLRAFTFRQIRAPQLREQGSWWERIYLDSARWRAVAYFMVHSVWGIFAGTVVFWGAVASVTALAAPVYWNDVMTARDQGLLGQGATTLLDWLPQMPNAAALMACGAVGVFLVLGCGWLVSLVDSSLGSALLGMSSRHVVAILENRVNTLTTSRTGSVMSVETERSQIERDLHDGPQQRMVSVAMTIDMAQGALPHNPAMAQELLAEAHASAKAAVVEIRDVARGIAPPILTERGLAAAVGALAARTPVPVSVSFTEIGRLDPLRERILYFCISESLTNAIKHSNASAISIVGQRTTNNVTAQVSDDGVGGAVITEGHGLAGLEQRVQSVDGTVEIDSPSGGPTTITISVPLPQENDDYSTQTTGVN